MKSLKIFRPFALAAVLMFAFSSSAMAYDTLKMLNATGKTIYYVYLVPSHYDTWGSDRLSGIWSNGNTLTLRVPDWKYYSLKIRFGDDTEAYWDTGDHRIDTEQVYKLTIVRNSNGRYTLIYNE